MDKIGLLREINFGQRVAEEETAELSEYFVETDQWQRLYRGDIDVVYGPKGAGKSALYALLLSKQSELRDRRIILAGAENPRGATAFRDLATSPPATEQEFVALWKLYIASLLYDLLATNNIDNSAVRKLQTALAEAGLIKGAKSLSGLLRAVCDYAKAFFRPQGIEGGLEFDPMTQMPVGINGKIVFSEPTRDGAALGQHSIENLMEVANEAFSAAGFSAWLVLDRLDVAFSELPTLEENALRALFRVYLDLLAHEKIQLKVFLRTDIWARITNKGFREASHITRHVTINWNRGSLLNLVVRRAVHNSSIRDSYGVSEELSRGSGDEQEGFFLRLCPRQVEVGPNKPNTFDWLLSRTRDGTKINAPRELIHFLNNLREVQVRRFEIGEAKPEGEQLFDRPAFKEALPEISKIRLEQTLYAEYPSLKEQLEKLQGSKTLHTPASLAAIWEIGETEAIARAATLVAVGFFEPRGSKASPEYWVPFMYREALDLVQGAAD